ncbi:helix-turn-helix domain-containing protein [Arsenophonus sp.]|uniref:helix-turn-helix domain-containing protein n=1 Tax=Arsenophonus sp. TaxID=1872640 RepID=UPI003879F00E
MKDQKSINSSLRIIQVLKKNGWSQSDLARRLSISPQAIQQWVKGISSPRGTNLKKLSEITGFPPHWFFMDEAEEKASHSNVIKSAKLSEQHRILIELFEKLPESEKNLLIDSLHEKQRHYDKLLEELAKARGKKII